MSSYNFEVLKRYKWRNNVKNLNEINLIRAMMCIAVVLTHSITSYLKQVDVNQQIYDQFILWIRLALLCATPIFILLSETLIAKNYPNGLKKGFFWKRIKYILIPYVLVGVVVSYKSSGGDFTIFINVLLEKVVYGQWYGFFVLVIFQFYILHWLIGKYLARVNPIGPILMSFIISFLHVYSYVHVSVYQDFVLTDYPFWYKTHILTWLFYFVVAFYIGQYYEQLIAFLIKQLWLPLLAVVGSYGVIAYNYSFLDYGRISSERYDMYLFAVSVFLFLVSFIRKFRLDNRTLMMISNFSFFIYLTHMIFLPYFVRLSLSFGDSFFTYVPSLAFLTVGSCIGVAFLLYQPKFTRNFTGKIAYLEPDVKPKKEKTMQPNRTDYVNA